MCATEVDAHKVVLITTLGQEKTNVAEPKAPFIKEIHPLEEMSRKRQRWCRLCKKLSAQLTEDSCAAFSYNVRLFLM